MAALPYMQMYWGDYYADTPHLSTEEHGAYLLLIGAYWQRGKSIPVNQLPSISKLNERWAGVERTLNEFFSQDEQGNWYHERIEQELEKVRSKSVKASAAGKASAAKRAEKQLQISERSTDVAPELQPQANHTDTDTDTDTDNKTPMSKAVACDHDMVIRIYCENLPELPGLIVSRYKGSAKEKAVRARWRENPKYQTPEFWEAFFKTVRTNPHWMGNNSRQWTADLGWLVKRENFDKVLAWSLKNAN